MKRKLQLWWTGASRALAAAGSPESQGLANELFPEPWPAPRPFAAEVNAVLQASDQLEPRVGASCLHLITPNARSDALEEAQHLLSEGYRPRPDAPLWPVRLPIDWAGDPFRDRNWRSQLNMLRLLDPLIRAYESSGDAQFLATALNWALDWHDFHVVRGHDHGLAWRDMMTGVRSLRLAYLADRLRMRAFDASRAQRAALADAVIEHWRRLTAPGFFRYINHTIWDLHGLTALVRVTLDEKDPRYALWMTALAKRLDHLVDAQFDQQGIHRENSPQYHFVASGMFRTLADSGWYDAAAPRLGERLDLARAQETWMRMPDGRHIPIGDSDGKAPSAASLLPYPTPEVEDDRTEWLNHSCYCFVRRLHAARPERWSYLAIKAGFDEAGHKHNDELSYLWSESGCDIVVDAGKYAYDQNPMRAHVLGNRAHNLVCFGGGENEARPAHRTGHVVHSLEREPWGVQMGARLRHRPTQVDHQRLWFFAPGRWLVVVDRFHAPHPIDFEHWTHLAPEFEVDCDGASLQAKHVRGGTLTIAHWSSVPTEVAHCRGRSGQSPQGWISRAYRSIEPAPAIGLGGRAQEATIVLALSLDPACSLSQDTPCSLSWATRDATMTLDVAPLRDGDPS